MTSKRYFKPPFGVNHWSSLLLTFLVCGAQSRILFRPTTTTTKEPWPKRYKHAFNPTLPPDENPEVPNLISHLAGINIKGIDPKRSIPLPNPDGYHDGKVCFTGQDPWTDAEMVHIYREARIVNHRGTTVGRLKQEMEEREQIYMNGLMNEVYGKNCKALKCIYHFERYTAICGAGSVQLPLGLLLAHLAMGLIM